jgi:hypothetical protein
MQRGCAAESVELSFELEPAIDPTAGDSLTSEVRAVVFLGGCKESSA